MSLKLSVSDAAYLPSLYQFPTSSTQNALPPPPFPHHLPRPHNIRIQPPPSVRSSQSLNTAIHTPLTSPTDIGVGMCPPPHTPASSRPLFKDCEYAINKKLPWLPVSYNVFYINGRQGPFKLPVQTVWKSCNVTVTLCGRGVVRAWTGVSALRFSQNLFSVFS